MVAVLLDGVFKRYPEGPALEGVTLRLEDGEAVALLGPSGSGKTTVLRILAGIEQVDSGDVLFGEESVTDAAPAQRNVAMVFQEKVLYPFLDVRHNIGFPLETRDLPAAEIAARVEAETRALGIAELLRRKPAQLSAGQRHIVQMAKAMVRAPVLLLIDEPFQGVDPLAARRLRTELRLIQRGYGVTALYATHEQEEAMAIADRVAVIESGRIRQVGTPDEVYLRPADVFVARFVGSPEMGMLRGVPASGGIAVGGMLLPGTGRDLVGEVLVGVRPEAWEIAREGILASVSRVIDTGSHAFAEVTTSAGEVTVRLSEAIPQVGAELAIHPTRYHLFDAATERAILHSP